MGNSPSNPNKCEKLADLMKAQLEVINRHVDEHKWFQHIPDQDKGVADFIDKYGWLMREMYCNHACSLKETCSLINRKKTK